MDPCKLYKNQSKYVHLMGYRLIPGDRCVGGWKPDVNNLSILKSIELCNEKLNVNSNFLVYF